MDMLYWSSKDRLNLETDWASSDVVEATGGLRFSKERVRGSVKALGVLHCLRGRTEEKVHSQISRKNSNKVRKGTKELQWYQSQV